MRSIDRFREFPFPVAAPSQHWVIRLARRIWRWC